MVIRGYVYRTSSQQLLFTPIASHCEFLLQEIGLLVFLGAQLGFHPGQRHLVFVAQCLYFVFSLQNNDDNISDVNERKKQNIDEKRKGEDGKAKEEEGGRMIPGAGTA